MRNSDFFDSSSSYAFALLTLLAVSSSPQTATASPLPVTRRTPFFLDFLYPEWYTAKTLSTAERKERIKPERSAATAPSSGSSRPASGARVRDKPLQQPQRPRASQQQPQQQQQRQGRRQLLAPTITVASPPLAKRTTTNGNWVPVKYESVDQAGGWVIDNTWDLHGHHRRADPSTSNSNNSLDNLPIQNLDTTSNSTDPTSYIDTTDTTDGTDDSGLDLPFGWQEGGLNPRHESYDPVIVAVFAVILVLCIVATIGLCRWRARKLRRLRDLERSEREKEGGGVDYSENGDNGSSIEDDAGSESGSRFSEKKKKKKSSIGAASSSAIRKRFARFRRRHRDRAKRNAEGKTGDAEEEQNPIHRVDDDEPTRQSSASIASGTTAALSRSSTSHRSRSSATLEHSTTAPTSDDLTIPITPISGMGVEPDPSAIGASERGRRPRITVTTPEITPAPTTTTLAILDPIMANAEPPAYPAGTSSANPNTNDTRSTRRTRTRTPLENSPHLPLPPEKAPIPGLEAEYDDRDLAGNSGLLANSNSGLFNSRLSTSGTGLSARSSAPPTRRPSRVRFADDPPASDGGMQDGGEGMNDAHAHAADLEGEEEEEEVPSFEPFASSPPFEPFASSVGTSLGTLGASRAAAGATLRAHVATDDKGVLERLINVSSEPPLVPPSPILGDSSGVPAHPDGRPAAAAAATAIVAAAPSFFEIDQWELERQMAQAHAHESASPTLRVSLDADLSSSSSVTTLPGSSAFGSSSRRAGTSSNGFPALPAPSLSVFSTGGGSGSGDVGYGLGTVWNSLNVAVGVPSMPLGSSGNGKARVPSAPPLATPASALRPSAPPPMLDEDEGMGTANGQAMPSAPPAWDEDEEEEEDGPILQPGTSTTEGHPAPDVDESRIVHQPNTVPLQDNEGDAGSDGDGAESVISTPLDNEEANSRWSATFRTRPDEGAGLPRYEP